LYLAAIVLILPDFEGCKGTGKDCESGDLTA